MLSKSLFRTLSLVALTSAMAAPALAQASLPIKSKRVVGGDSATVFPVQILDQPHPSGSLLVSLTAGAAGPQ